MIKCTLEDLYKFNKLTSKVDDGFFKVKTRNGFKKIENVDVTSKNSKQIEISTKNGYSLIGSPDHLIMSNTWIKLKDIILNETKVLTIDGFSKIIKKIELKERDDLLDIQVDGKEYYSNGIISHNSTIKEALTISAFGRSAIRKMKDIPNWINKSAYTYCDFDTPNGDNIVIERGIDPNFTEFKLNSIPDNRSDKRIVDDLIENKYLGINFQTFCNTISLSFDDFKSFIKLSPNDKRKIVDPIFGIDILTDMKKELSKDVSKNQKNYDIIVSNIQKNTELLEKSQNQLEELKEKLNEAAESKENEINEKIGEKSKAKDVHKKKYGELKTQISKFNDGLTEYRNKIATSKADIAEYWKKLEIFKNKKCPHCLSDLTTEGANHIKNEISSNKVKEENNLTKLIESGKKIKLKIDKLTEDRDLEKDEFYKLSNEITTLEEEVERLKNNDQSEQESSISKIINTIEYEISESEGQSRELQKKLEMYGILDDALGDKGIKRVLIDKVIPLLNTRIFEISDRLEFKFNFEFDSDFNPIIRYMGMDVSPESLSTGQRKKMNLIVLLSFIELIKMKHTNLNVMFLDEIFSGLDKKNVYKAIEILREYADMYKMTIFVVSHESLPEEFFDKKIEVEMKNHYSEMNIIFNTRKLKTN